MDVRWLIAAMVVVIWVVFGAAVYVLLGGEIKKLAEEVPPPEPQLITVLVEAPAEEPPDIVIDGVKQPVSEYKELTVEATAYTNCDAGMDCRGITKSGLTTARGTIAVDPEVIPLGSVLWVEGYGYGIALDTGSAIKGNKIDVFFNQVDDALEWGRKDVKVRVY